MKRLRSIPKILKINEVSGYKVSCLFSNGESRIIDFEQFFKSRNRGESHPSNKLLQKQTEFKQVELIGHTIGWRNTGISARNLNGDLEFYPYDIDPLVLFEHSTLDEPRNLQIGKLIRQARKKAGLTQEELAVKSGTTKNYISRLENDKSDIELLTLKKIIEGGLGKNLEIHIH